MYDRTGIEKIYCDHGYEKHPYFSYNEIDFNAESKERFRNKNRALERVEKMIGVGKLLDVGCGAGDFLHIASKRGWDVSGVELSPQLSNLTKNKDYYVVNDSFEDANLSENIYDLITFWDVIEHVIDPVYCVKKAKRLLKPNGIAIFCTPNEDSLLARIGLALYKYTASYYSYPALALHPDNHTYFFSKKSFEKIVERAGMKWLNCHSQAAFFEHSKLANGIQKLGIATVEKTAKVFDSCYEMVVLVRP